MIKRKNNLILFFLVAIVAASFFLVSKANGLTCDSATLTPTELTNCKKTARAGKKGRYL